MLAGVAQGAAHAAWTLAEPPPPHAGDRAHPRHPRRAHHVRPQVPGVERGARARPRAAGSAPRRRARSASSRARSARWRTSTPALEVEALRVGSAWRPSRSRTRSCSATATPRCWRRSRCCGGTLEKIALEIRHLQRTEVREAEEPFARAAEGLLGDAAQAQPGALRARVRAGAARCAATRRPALENQRAVARARHQPLVGRARDPAGRVPASLDFMACEIADVLEHLRVNEAHAARTSTRAAGSCSRSACCSRSPTAGLRARRGVPHRAGARAGGARRRAGVPRPRSQPTRACRRALTRRALAGCFDSSPSCATSTHLFARAAAPGVVSSIPRPAPAYTLDELERPERGVGAAARARRALDARRGARCSPSCSAARRSGRRRCCSASCGASTARTSRRATCCTRLPTQRAAGDPRPGEDAGVVRAAGAVRGPGAGAGAREPQPSEPGAAGRGRGHRRRRHRARRGLHGRRGRRRARRAALRRSARAACACATSCAAWCRASPTTATRSACRTWAATSCFDAGVRRQLPGERDGGRRRRRSAACCGAACPRVRVRGRSCWSASRPTRAASAARRSRPSELGAADDRGAVQLPDPFLKRVLHGRQRRGVPRASARAASRPGSRTSARAVSRAPRASWPPPGGAAPRSRSTTCIASRARCRAEVLLCAETQERFCWVVPESFAAELCDLYNASSRSARVYPGAGARVIGRGHGRAPLPRDAGARTTAGGLPGRRDHAADGACARPSRRRAPAAPTAIAPRAIDRRAALLTLLSGFDLCSREYLYRHYDGEVQGRTWLRRGEGDAVVIRVHPERATQAWRSASAATRTGAATIRSWARATPWPRRRATSRASGGRPWALTDCLNFGDPEDPTVMGDLEATIEGLAVGGARARRPGVARRRAAVREREREPLQPHQALGNPAVADRAVRRRACATGGADGLRRCGARATFWCWSASRATQLTGSAFVREVLREPAGAPPALDLRARGAAAGAGGARRPRAAGCAPRTTSRTAGSRSRSPRWRLPRRSARASAPSWTLATLEADPIRRCSASVRRSCSRSGRSARRALVPGGARARRCWRGRSAR